MPALVCSMNIYDFSSVYEFAIYVHVCTIIVTCSPATLDGSINFLPKVKYFMGISSLLISIHSYERGNKLVGTTGTHIIIYLYMYVP